MNITIANPTDEILYISKVIIPFTEEQLSAIIGEIEAKRGLKPHAPSPEAD